MIEYLYVNIFGEWRELGDTDAVDGISTDDWLRKHNLLEDPLPTEFIHVVYEKTSYVLHKSCITVLRR